MKQGRIFIVLGSVAIILLIVFISISYFSYEESAKKQDFFHLKQYGQHISSLLKLKSANGIARHDKFEHQEYEVFIYQDKSGPRGLSNRGERFELLEQLFPFARLTKKTDEFSTIKLRGRLYYWFKLPINDNKEFLFVIHERENLQALYIQGFGPSLLVFTVFLFWCAVWGSLILNRLFKNLHDKTDMLQEQTKEIIKARDAAYAADRAKSRFLANISHELRTPLTAIIGFSESMYEEDSPLQERREHLETIIRNSNYLLHIINEVLDQSKIDEDKLKVEKIAFSPVLLLKDIENLIRQQIESKGLEFKVNLLWPLPDKIVGDPLRTKQVILNLCANAIKFTERGFIHVTTSFDTNEECLSVVVSDSGIGISAQQQETIFSPFIQADISITRRFGGTGLGLSLTKRLIELMGGKIMLDSEQDSGSQFLVELPTGPVAAENMLTAADAERVEANPFSVDKVVQLSGRVLIAEDAPDNQLLVKAMLEKVGLEVKVVGDGRQAVEAAGTEAWDLILMDMQMPVMDGITALQRLREKGYRIPIIALTANTQAEDRALYFEAGFNDFVGKPIRRRILYNVLAKHLQNESLEKLNKKA